MSSPKWFTGVPKEAGFYVAKTESGLQYGEVTMQQAALGSMPYGEWFGPVESRELAYALAAQGAQ